jgi:hypothetical protein
MIALFGADPAPDQPEAAGALTGTRSIPWKHDILTNRPLSVDENVLAAVHTTHHVIERARIFDSHGARHGASVSG